MPKGKARESGKAGAVPGAVSQAAEWAAANPGTAICGAVGVAFLAAPMAAVAPVLGAVGFGTGGIVGGSLAAGIQAGIGSVAAGSTFATLQSAAMGGYGAAVVGGAVQGLGGVLAGIAGRDLVKGKGGPSASGDTPEDDELLIPEWLFREDL